MMTDLADQCERFPKADRGLDWEIHLRNGLSGVGAYGAHPPYTGSLDAAMSLKPEGWCVDAGTGGGPYAHGPWARCYPDNQRGQMDGTGNRNAATMALAICSAALRAHGIIQQIKEAR